MKLLREFCRIFVAILFIFSGFVKIVDPIGTSIKLQKYFHIFSNNFTSLFELFIPASLFIAVLVISLEMILGFALLLNYKMKTTSWVLLALILFFTALTLYTAITGDPKDCGCFGDFIKLTPWQSFSKDVVLTVLILIIFFNKDKFSPVLSFRSGTIVMALLSFATVYFAIWTIRHLPVIDFRPYAIGKNIKEQTTGTPDVYHYKFKKGEEEIITPETKMEYFKPPYEYVGTVLVEKGKEAPIVDFHLDNVSGEDLRNESLEGKSLYIVIRKTKSLSEELIEELRALEEVAATNNVKVYLVTSIGEDEYNSLLKENLAGRYTMLDTDISKAVIRGEIGVLTLRDGTVKGKWHWRDLPESQELLNSYE